MKKLSVQPETVRAGTATLPCARGRMLRGQGVSQPPRRLSASGFTLIEVILAVALTTTLMAALYAAMNIYWSTATESRAEIERAQIARALLRQMARDIQSVTFVEQPATETSDDNDDPEPVSADDVIYDNGLVGTGTDLMLYTSRPERELNYVVQGSGADATFRSSDGLIIRYVLAEPTGAGLGALVASQYVSGNLAGPAGLARMEGDLNLLNTAVQAGDQQSQLACTKLLAAEVSNVTFSYFDGTAWQAEWDSTQLNAMPNAVEILLELRTVDENRDQTDVDRDPRTIAPTTHRLVVSIPVSLPYVGDE